MEPIVWAAIIVGCSIGVASWTCVRALRRTPVRRDEHPQMASTPSEFGELREGIVRLERSVTRLARTLDRVADRVGPPGGANESRDASEGSDPRLPLEPTRPARRARPALSEVRSLADRGRDSVEIAQLLDVDVGEVELMLRLSAAAQRPR